VLSPLRPGRPDCPGPSSTADLAALTPHKIQSRLANGTRLVESLGALTSSLSFALPIIGPLVAGVKLGLQIPVVTDTLASLEAQPGWKWYRQHGTVTGLGAEATMRDVLLRVQALSLPGTPERDMLVNELLPAAFMADLSAALVEARPPQAWSPQANVVIFLDGFQDLQRSSSTTATLLLQGLTTEPRRQGHTDPLLLVIGTHDPLAGMTADEQPVAFPRTVEDGATARQHMHDLHAQWRQGLPSTPRALRRLRPENLVLPLWLQDFGPAHTRSYLIEVGEREQTAVFAADNSLVQAIDQVTHGHPLFLALAAEAVLEADALGQPLDPTEFELQRARVSPEIAPEHEAEAIGEYLLELFLKQLPDSERQELIRCAVPRVLDVDILRVLLPSLDRIDAPADERWQAIRQRSFLNAVNQKRSVVHPVVRRLLLRRVTVSADPNSDFVRIHTQLQDHFTQRARSGEDEAGIEAAYHALALGDADPAIRLGILAQQGRLPLSLWEPLLEAVRQAPTALLPEGSKARADKAGARAEMQHETQDAATAVVLYTWLLSAAHDDREESAGLQKNLGIAYWALPTGDRAANLQHAITCYQAASQVHTREAFPANWAATQNNLGLAYAALPTGDRAANLQSAIACFQAALQVYTRGAFPADWARTQYNLGNAYSDLSTGDREANLRRAIACFQAASQVYTQETSPADWAVVQNSLEAAYRSRMDIARERGWTPVETWGSGGWALGSWPEVVVYHHDMAESFDLTFDIAGDATDYSFPSQELRDAATDEVAFYCWKLLGAPWVEGVETAQQMPAQLRGPYMPPSASEHMNGVE
jgi:tetratricopeptide (TPR) repeat protein